MISCVPSATVVGVDGHAVTVEVHVASGLPSFTVVGLPDTSCREARDRVRAAIVSSGLKWPMTRITVNLAPATIRKVGAATDLAMAIGVLVANEELRPEVVGELAFLGELGLDGSVRAVAGALPMVDAMPQRTVVVASGNVAEAEMVGGRRIVCAADLRSVVEALEGRAPWSDPPTCSDSDPLPPEPDLTDVRGRGHARLALEVAAAGGHHMLLVGPPGAGKTMLARRLPGLLGSLGSADALQVSRIHSVAGERLPGGRLHERPPFRAPHHTASIVSLVGGGSGSLRPGELSLAHAGVLFLDEMGEFDAVALDALRQPLEEGVVRVSRAWGSVELPARVVLVGAMNPCPCGYGGSARCRCSDSARLRYARRLSGPLLDRFDLRVAVSPVGSQALLGESSGESSAVVAERVSNARARAAERGVRCNAELSSRRLEELTTLSPSAVSVLAHALENGSLSPRGLRRVRTVALTLDDLAGGDGHLDDAPVCAALSLRQEVGRLTGDPAWG